MRGLIHYLILGLITFCVVFCFAFICFYKICVVVFFALFYCSLLFCSHMRRVARDLFVCVRACVRGLIHYLSNTGADNFFVLNCVVFCVLFICFYKIHCLMSESYVCMRSAVSLCACNVSCVRECVRAYFVFVLSLILLFYLFYFCFAFLVLLQPPLCFALVLTARVRAACTSAVCVCVCVCNVPSMRVRILFLFCLQFNSFYFIFGLVCYFYFYSCCIQLPVTSYRFFGTCTARVRTACMTVVSLCVCL